MSSTRQRSNPLGGRYRQVSLYIDRTLRWRHNERDCVTNHQPHDCLLSRLFRRRSKETSKLRATGLCPGKSSVTEEFPAQRVSNAENISIWWTVIDRLCMVFIQKYSSLRCYQDPLQTVLLYKCKFMSTNKTTFLKSKLIEIDVS